MPKTPLQHIRALRANITFNFLNFFFLVVLEIERILLYS